MSMTKLKSGKEKSDQSVGYKVNFLIYGFYLCIILLVMSFQIHENKDS